MPRGLDLIAKASAVSHHIPREVDAHREFLGRFRGWVPSLVHASVEDRILVAEYLPGDLVVDTPAEWQPEVYRRAGERLARLLVPGAVSTTYAEDLAARSAVSINAADGLVEPRALRELRSRLESTRRPLARLSFTHGDFQPRNWLLDGDDVRVIDFGRAAQRPWTSELVRLNFQQFVDHPELEGAFHDGLDRPLASEDADLLTLETINQSIGTVVWAHGIGDTAFEAHGRRMIERLLGL